MVFNTGRIRWFNNGLRSHKPYFHSFNIFIIQKKITYAFEYCNILTVSMENKERFSFKRL